MKAEEAIQQFTEKWSKVWDEKAGFVLDKDHEDECLSDLTALISEHYYPKEEAGYPEKFISHMLMYKTFRDCFTQLYNHWDGHKYLEFKTLDELFNYWKENEK